MVEMFFSLSYFFIFFTNRIAKVTFLELNTKFFTRIFRIFDVSASDLRTRRKSIIIIGRNERKIIPYRWTCAGIQDVLCLPAPPYDQLQGRRHVHSLRIHQIYTGTDLQRTSGLYRRGVRPAGRNVQKSDVSGIQGHPCRDAAACH